ncbi:MAG: four-carbon acid sugar kinase family protein [Castellaniella sp.]|uniref:3-oxo-tetronate kinase n=1 Tax=Castellaniella sp. TaxID=1955812 RepID=UPI001219D720|nr:3-oxo-tetronate kinase [Castellaniella sp.]TAN26672.1 MAG: four-carbon acid sugar kinase family protein [Castellaniella sp.]
MLLGCIADDFTGASDLANTLAKGGMSTVQFAGVPQSADAPDCEAGVVALKTRSIAADDAVRQSLQALRWLQDQGCRQFIFKYCSTFDSTPTGNIGPVAEALRVALQAPLAIVCPAFPETGRTLFMGHLFVKGRLLNESGMEHHPLNPMTDADLCRWLGRQTKAGVGLVPYPTVRQGPAAVTAAMDAEAAAGRPLVVVDAVLDEDLMTLGQAIAQQTLITGGSGIALGLPENFRRAGLLADAGSGFEPIQGPGVVLSGSCSTASNAQVAHHLKSHPGLKISTTELMEERLGVQDALSFIRAHLHQDPIVYSTADPESVSQTQARFGREAVANRIEHFFAELSRQLIAAGVRRLVVGGGETSGAVVTALKLESLRVGPEIDPGVPALASEHPTPLRLALKSGNFGTTDFYDKALRTLQAASR